MVTAHGSVQEDVYERTANSTSIALDITPAAPGEVKVNHGMCQSEHGAVLCLPSV
jgi:hypothetical protein